MKVTENLSSSLLLFGDTTFHSVKYDTITCDKFFQPLILSLSVSIHSSTHHGVNIYCVATMHQKLGAV